MMTRDPLTAGALHTVKLSLLGGAAALLLSACAAGAPSWAGTEAPSAQEVAAQAAAQTHADDGDALVLYSTNIPEDRAVPDNPPADDAALQSTPADAAENTDEPGEAEDPATNTADDDTPETPDPADTPKTKKTVNPEPQ